MTEYSYELKIPKDRVAVLIGKEGEVKKGIEDETKSKIKIDSKEGDIFVSGEDALGLYTCRELVLAVGRGFNPDIAKLLLKQDYVLEIVNLNEYAGKSKNTALRLKGRTLSQSTRFRSNVAEFPARLLNRSRLSRSSCGVGAISVRHARARRRSGYAVASPGACTAPSTSRASPSQVTPM